MVMLLTETVLLGCAHPYSTTVVPAGMVMSLEEVAALNKVSQRVKEEYTCTCGCKEGAESGYILSLPTLDLSSILLLDKRELVTKSGAALIRYHVMIA